MNKLNCILIVDDNPTDNEFHTLAIKEAEVCNHVKVATNGEMALDYLKKSGDPIYSEAFPAPGIIYLDINMPGMNGFDFLEEYKKLCPEIKAKALFIMLTVSLSPDDERKAKSYNEVSEFNFKPLTAVKIRETVERFFLKNSTFYNS